MKLNMYNVELKNDWSGKEYAQRLLAPNIIAAIRQVATLERYKPASITAVAQMLDAEQIATRTDYLRNKDILVAGYPGYWQVRDVYSAYLLLQYDRDPSMRLVVNVYDWYWEHDYNAPPDRPHVRAPYYADGTEHYDVYDSDKHLVVLLVKLGLLSTAWLTDDDLRLLLEDLSSIG